MANVLRALFVGDASASHSALIVAFKAGGFDTLVAATVDKALGSVDEDIHTVCCDYQMEELSGIRLALLWKSRSARTAFILLDSVDNSEHAKEAIRAGAKDYFPISANIGDIISSAQREIKTSEQGSDLICTENKKVIDRIVGRTPVMQEVRSKVVRAASSETPVLLEGQSGTGKDLAAEIIHAMGRRTDRPLRIVNCSSSLPEGPNWIEDLMRHIEGGTLLLDEIGDFDLGLQGRILTLLQYLERATASAGRESQPLRLMAATSKNLREMTETGKFRADLFYRLDVVRVMMPPLRERWADVPLLVEYFLRQLKTLGRTHGISLDQSALDCLQRYQWPGNVRELRNMLEGAAVMASTPVLKAEDLPVHVWRACNQQSIGNGPSAGDTLGDLEWSAIARALKECGGNRTHAARKIGISVRTLQRKLRQHETDGAHVAGAGL
jgi:DNA-binding NtrC family response regulator